VDTFFSREKIMIENILPGEPTTNTINILTNAPISETPVADAPISVSPVADERGFYISRRLFSVAVVCFAIWYFGFRKKGE
jgi:hypothetical protein